MGVALLVAVIWIPIAWWIKLIVLASVITLNSVRMVLSSKKKKNKQEIKDQISQSDQTKNTTSAPSSQVKITNQKTEN